MLLCVAKSAFVPKLTSTDFLTMTGKRLRYCNIRCRRRPFRANRNRMHRRTISYSITSSARASNAVGKVNPIDRAVRRFMTSLICVGSSNGSSATLVPLKIRST